MTSRRELWRLVSAVVVAAHMQACFGGCRSNRLTLVPLTWSTCTHNEIKFTGVEAQIAAEKHPKGVRMLLAFCNHTSQSAKIAEHCLPHVTPNGRVYMMQNVFHLEGYLGEVADYGGDLAPSIPPGQSMSFTIELLDHYQLQSGRTYSFIFGHQLASSRPSNEVLVTWP